MPTMLSGEGVADGSVESLDSRKVDIHLLSHLSTGFAILEQSDDGLLSGGSHCCWGVIIIWGVQYILERLGHMIFKV